MSAASRPRRSSGSEENRAGSALSRMVTMADHDQRLKTLLREFFLEFFRLFFPVWAERFDFSRTEWLEQEIFPDPPQGQRRAIDLLAKLPTRQPVSPFRPGESASWIALIHAEVEQA